MDVGNIVKFLDGLYPDEEKAKYRVIEINGDRVIIEFICDLPIPPQSVANISDLEAVLSETDGGYKKIDRTRNERQARRRGREKEWLDKNGWRSWESLHSALMNGSVILVIGAEDNREISNDRQKPDIE